MILWTFTAHAIPAQACELVLFETMPASGAVGVPVDVAPWLTGDFCEAFSIEVTDPLGTAVPFTSSQGERRTDLLFDADLAPSTQYTLTVVPQLAVPTSVVFTTGAEVSTPSTGMPTVAATVGTVACEDGLVSAELVGDYTFPVLGPFEAGFVDWSQNGFVGPGSVALEGSVSMLFTGVFPLDGEPACFSAYVRYADGELSEPVSACVTVLAPPDCAAPDPEPEPACGCRSATGTLGAPFLLGLAVFFRRRA